MPGLLQIPEFVRARVDAEVTLKPSTPNANGVLAGRVGRQRMLRRPGGPTYEVIVDEVAVQRLAAPSEIVKKQLYYLTTAVNGEPKVTLRVLPVQARIESFASPRRGSISSTLASICVPIGNSLRRSLPRGVPVWPAGM